MAQREARAQLSLTRVILERLAYEYIKTYKRVPPLYKLPPWVQDNLSLNVHDDI